MNERAPRVTAHPLERPDGKVGFLVYLYDGTRIVSPPNGVDFSRADLQRTLSDLDQLLRSVAA